MTVSRLIQWSALLALAWSVPIDRNVKPAEETPATPQTQDTGLYYDRYLREVIDVLETDSHFREKLQAANADDIKSGKLSKELDFVGHHVRSKLDELKRQEVSRLRMLIKAKMDATAQQNVQMDHAGLLKQFEHLDQQNQQTFEAKDLELLIETATRDLESYDSARHEEFKRYEMLKEHERREYLRSLEQEKRESEEKREEERKQRHREHPKINVPGSRDQLKKVWEETDGLDPQEFNPKTFFKLHDSNGDGVLDEQELEALFTKELEKVYDPKNEDDDMTEMEEERLRMREHVMRNVDANHDRLITLEEFLKSTERKDFANTDEWETVDEKPVYTEEELKQFEAELTAQEAELGKRAEELKREHEDLKERERELELQKKEYQEAVIQMAQKQKAPQAVEGQPPSGPNGELQFHGESKGAAEIEEKKPFEAAPVSDGNPPPAEPPQNQPQQTP